MKTLRVIGQTRYEDRGYSNEESIAYLQLQKPEEINSFLTYNYGMDDDRFPLSFITEVPRPLISIHLPITARRSIAPDSIQVSVVGSDETADACDNRFMVQVNFSSPDILMVGAGVMGMLSGLELAEAGQKVLMIDRGRAGLEASWAGGGIISPLYHYYLLQMQSYCCR